MCFFGWFIIIIFWGKGGGYVRVWFRCLVICNILLGVKIYNYYLYKVLFL